MSLATLYQKASVRTTVLELAQSKKIQNRCVENEDQDIEENDEDEDKNEDKDEDNDEAQKESSNENIYSSYIHLIMNKCKILGSHTMMSDSNLNEECERELEKEEEQEQEIEQRFEKKQPRLENDWNYDALFRPHLCHSFSSFGQIEDLAIHPLKGINSFLQINHFDEISWPDNVYLTENFLLSLNNFSNLSQFIRPVDGLLKFNTGEILIMSERESEKILDMIYDNDSLGLPFTFSNKSIEVHRNNPTMSSYGSMLSIQIFSGDTFYPKEEKECVSYFSLLFALKNSMIAVNEIIKCRGEECMFPMSPLDIISRQILY
jgi:hypothetical protein